MKLVAAWVIAAGLMASTQAYLPQVRADHHETPPSTQPAEAVKPYPLTVCIVSDEALGSMGEETPVVVHEGQEFKFCCPGCIDEFNKDPQKYHEKLDKAVAGDAAHSEDGHGHHDHAHP